MEQVQDLLVFPVDECEVLADIVGTFLINNFEDLDVRQCNTLHAIRHQAYGRVVATSEGLFDDGGIFYTERKQAMMDSIDARPDSPEDDADAQQDFLMRALVSLPETAAEARTLTVTNAALARSAIRWAAKHVIAGHEPVQEVVDAIHPEVRAEMGEQINKTGMYATLWAMELGENVPESS